MLAVVQEAPGQSRAGKDRRIHQAAEQIIVETTHRIRQNACFPACRAAAFCAALLALPGGLPAAADEDPYMGPRADMVRTIAAYVLLSQDALGRDFMDPKVMEVMGAVPRHAFLPEESGQRDWLSRLLGSDLDSIAYADRPIPIGYGQTMSQPFIVALMTDLLALGEDSVVLEIGTGSAYQAAVLAGLVAQVYTIEIVEPLGRAARQRLARLGYDNVEVRIGDGYDGWAEHAPFDAIMVTAAASHVPPPLLDQLKPGGRLVIPVGDRFLTQQLILIEKHDDGALTATQVLPVRFVPLVRAE